ncbi:DUF3291 domain-containing protein [Defluviimonas aestuarii]|uniref:DUF3291 domain-containing protein n=1 Tax=Albidovulum aestuarii TaxID=1130726 RepID=UPI00249B17A7|nr:DUF3291 domain-containing protein [Defluviimonas aestuarii]MDI3335021.1 DUF3291 domain-containing protein [Defluviimonas aestuarii]
MKPVTQHIAELNIGQLWHPLDDPRTAGFTDNSDRLNAVAERSQGFVWRCLPEEAERETQTVNLYDGDPCALWTMSVWETPDDLEAFVHRTVHGAFLKRRSEWFKPQDHKTYVIWPITVGHTPTLREGLDRLARLQADGPSSDAYDFKTLMARKAEGSA